MDLDESVFGGDHVYCNDLNASISRFLKAIGCLDENSDVDFPGLMSHILKCMGLFLKLRALCVKYTVPAAEAKVFLGSVLEMCEFGIATSEGLSFSSTRLPAGVDLAIHTFKNKHEGAVSSSAADAGVEVQASNSRSSVWLPLYWAVMSPRWKAPNELQLLMDTAENSVDSQESASPSPGISHFLPISQETLIHCAAKAVHDNTEVLRLLSRRAPRAAFTQDVDGNLSLHAAAQYTESVENLRYLLQLNPKAIRSQNKRGRTPIHVLADRVTQAQLPLLECLLDVAHPDDLMIQDESDDTPLHLAWYVWSMKDAIVSKRVFDANPKAALVANSMNELPIHCIATQYGGEGLPSTSTFTELQSLVEVMISYFNTISDSNSDDYPLLKPDANDFTPLHNLCHSSPGSIRWRLIPTVLKACPRAASIIADSMTPLDTYLSFTNSSSLKNDEKVKEEAIDSVRKLLVAYPLAASIVRDFEAAYLLHTAAKYSPLEIVRLIYDAYPAAASFNSAAPRPRDTPGTPLHYAAMNKSPTEGPKIIRFLYEKYPEAALISKTGSRTICTPLHYAVVYSSFWESMKVLCELEPAALKELNAAGETPYRLAARIDASSHIQRMLLRAAPEVDADAFRNLNYAARRGALYLLYSAVPCDDSGGAMMIWLKLRECADASLIRTVVSFL